MSNIRANTISDTAGTGPITLTGQSAAKAWVNFNGTGTPAIRDSVNVGSITDNGTGQYAANFSNNFANGNYSAVASSTEAGTGLDPLNYTASQNRVVTRNSSQQVADTTFVLYAMFGDLA